jgi:lipopolysaccharide exporter
LELGTIAVTTVLQLIYTATMSRLLQPDEFGLMAAALVGLRFVTFFSRFGLASAVIQRPSLDDTDISTAVRLAVLIGGAAAVITFLVSPLLAAIVDVPETTGVMRWMSIAVLAGAVSTIPEAVLRRRMRFRVIGVIHVVSYLIGYLLVGIVAAQRGWGVWSLVAASITQVGATLLLSLAAARPPIRTRFSATSARSMVRFGGTVTATGFVEFLSLSIDTLAVGRWAGAAALGQYSRATLLVGLPVEQATTATSRVLMPSLSRVQSDAPRFSAAVVTMVGLLAVVVVVPVSMIAAGTPTLVPWLLGEGWDDAARIVPIVGAAYGLSMLTHGPAVAAEARGAIGRKFNIQLLALATTIALVGIAVASGPTLTRLALAWALGEFARHLYYWIWMFGHLGLDRRAIAVRYAAAGALGVVAAAPLLWAVRAADMEGFWPMAGAAVIGLGLAATLVLSPVGSILRRDVAAVRTRMRTPAPTPTE